MRDHEVISNLEVRFGRPGTPDESRSTQAPATPSQSSDAPNATIAAMFVRGYVAQQHAQVGNFKPSATSNVGPQLTSIRTLLHRPAIISSHNVLPCALISMRAERIGDVDSSGGSAALHSTSFVSDVRSWVSVRPITALLGRKVGCYVLLDKLPSQNGGT